MMNKSDQMNVHLEGHLVVTEYDSRDDMDKPGHVLLDKRNAIHPEHASILIARAIANRDNGSFYTMHFGTGGATVDPLGNISYATPNTSGAADLNNPAYFEVIDDLEGAPSGNLMAVRHINGTLFSDVEIRCVIDKNEPFGQPAFDNIGGTDINTSNFVFSEVGLKTEDGLLVTHVTFSPVEKSANRIIEVVYTVRVSIST